MGNYTTKEMNSPTQNLCTEFATFFEENHRTSVKKTSLDRRNRRHWSEKNLVPMSLLHVHVETIKRSEIDVLSTVTVQLYIKPQTTIVV